jgi:glutamine amidotransferase
LCLGAQLLLDGSEEAPGVPGLGFIGGQVVRLKTRTVPHMGWNRIRASRTNELFEAADAPYVYFAHSYVCRPEDPADVAAMAESEGEEFCVAVQRGRLFGVQFHPEKSAEAGLALLRSFAEC